MREAAFTAVFGSTRGLGLLPGKQRLQEKDLSGYAQFVYVEDKIGAQTREREAAGAEPRLYLVCARLRLTDEQWEGVCAHPHKQHEFLEDLRLSVGTTAPRSLLREVDDIKEYSPEEMKMFWRWGYYEAVELISPQGLTMLLLDTSGVTEHGPWGLAVGWPCPSPDEDSRPWVECQDFVGCFIDGYTADDINNVLPELSQTLGVQMLCLWDDYDSLGGKGDSEILAVGEDNALVSPPWGLLELLSDPDTVFTRINAATTGKNALYEQESYRQREGSNCVYTRVSEEGDIIVEEDDEDSGEWERW